MIGNGAGRRRRRMCRRMLMMLVRVRQSAIDRAEILRRRAARVALSRRILVAVRATGAHQMAVVLVEQSAHPQQIANADQIRS